MNKLEYEAKRLAFNGEWRRFQEAVDPKTASTAALTCLHDILEEATPEERREIQEWVKRRVADLNEQL